MDAEVTNKAPAPPPPVVFTDAAASKVYFEQLFNWKLRPIDDGSLIIVENWLPGFAPAGLITQAEHKPGFTPGPVFYIQVDSIG